MAGRGNCKCCSSPQREYIDQALADRVPYRVICEELAARGAGSFSLDNISNHRIRHWEPPADGGMVGLVNNLREQLEREMRTAPPMLAAGYLVVLHQLPALLAAKASPETLIKAVTALRQLGGLNTEQAGLLAFMAAGDAPGGMFYKERERRRLEAVPDESA
jgi:hypothetical protein